MEQLGAIAAYMKAESDLKSKVRSGSFPTATFSEQAEDEEKAAPRRPTKAKGKAKGKDE